MCHKSVKFTMKVDGMKCEGCVKRIENILEKERNVNSYQVDLEEKKIQLLVKKNTDIQNIANKIEALDFKITIIK